MTNSAKKKKQRKADFQKVKLKLGRKLPKGNVVNTTFKAKKIVIRDQLKQKTDSPGKADKNIKDYLNKLEHYSSAVRLELVRHLKKSLTDYPDLICSHLNLLIERLSWLITDVDAQVRKQGISLLKLVLSNADPDHILPFFPVVVAHLRCALTHISHDIQKDGLPLVDLLVDTFPQHLKYFSKHLLQDFLNQISSQIKPFLTANSNNAHTIKRVLTSDPARKIVGIQWYLQVCRRLQNVLKGIFKSSSGTQSINLSDSGKIIKWENIDEKLTWPIYTNEVTTEAYSRREHLKDFFEDEAHLKSLLSGLMPLMFEMWVEAASLSEGCGEKNMVNRETLDVYTCIAEIVNTVGKIAERWQEEERESDFVEWYASSYMKSFVMHCMSGFPYGDLNSVDKKEPTQSTPDNLNIILCNMLACSALSSDDKDNHINVARNYIMSIFLDDDKLPNSDFGTLVSVLRKILERESDDANQKLIESVRLGLRWLPSESVGYKHVLDLLIDIVQLPQYSHIFKLPAMLHWISEIPAIVASYTVVPWRLLQIMTLVAPRSYPDFLTNLVQHFPKVLENLLSLKFDNDEPLSALKLIITMLYWIPKVDVSLFRHLATLCHDKDTSWDLSVYILDVLNSRFLRCNQLLWCDGPTHYFSFLLSVAFGVSKKELEEMNSSASFPNQISSVEILNFSRVHHIVMGPKDHLHHYRKLTKMGISSVMLLNTASGAEDYIGSFLDQILEGYSRFPLRSAYAILYCTSQAWRSKNFPENFLPSLTSLTLSFLEHLVTVEGMEKEFFEVVDEIMKVPELSQPLCSKMVSLASEPLNKDAIMVLGEVALLLIKACNVSHKKSLLALLKALKMNNEVYVKNMHWYISGKYELVSRL